MSDVQGFRGAIINVVMQQVNSFNGAKLLKDLMSPDNDDTIISFGEYPDNPNPKLPYIVVRDDGEDPQYMGVGVKEAHHVTFIFMADSLDVAEQIEVALKNLFDPNGAGLVLKITNGQRSGGGHFMPGGLITKMRHPQRTTSGQWLYKGEFPYRTIVNR